MQTERVKPLPSLLEPLRSLPLVLTCLFVAVAAVDALVALQPGLLSALRSRWHDALPAGTSPWATLSAAAVIVGGVALAATVLASFIRAVRAAPYLCLAPLWVGACMLVIGRLPFVLPLPLPPPAFISSCALLFVGGGVVFERRALLWNILGVLLCLLPPGLLALGYALAPGAAFDGNAALLLFVVVLAAAGAPIIAIASRVHGARLGPVTAEELGEREMLAREEQLGAQIAELAERARASEERAALAERQLAVQPAWQPRLQADELTPAQLPRRGGGLGWIAAALLMIVVAGAIAGYVLAYMPLQTELTSQLQHNAMQAEAQSDAIAALRAGYERERQALEQQLTAVKEGLAAQAAAQPAAEPAALTSPEDDKRAARLAKREEARIAHEQRAAELLAAREARSAAREQRAAELLAARETRSAEREQRVQEARAEREQRAAEGQPVRSERKPRATSSASEQAPAPAPAAPQAAQPAAPRDALDAENDDPLEGL